LLGALALAVFGACRTDEAGADRRPQVLRIASFDFAESRVLGEIYAAALRQKGFEVVHEAAVGAREVVAPALEQGLVDLVPEYLGTSLTFVTLGRVPPSPRSSRAHAQLRAAYAEHGVSVLDYALAENRNTIAVTYETGADLRLETISDLRPHAPEMTFGGPPECPERPLCLEGLEHVYGLHFESFLPLDAGGPATVAALESGEVDAALLFSTDPNLVAFTPLVDDLHLQPAENIVPVVRTDVVEREGPRLVRVLNSVTRLITTARLRELNGRVQLDEPYGLVARAWLDEVGWPR
jgi:osmoprotectant transport system substrate-binding protein